MKIVALDGEMRYFEMSVDTRASLKPTIESTLHSLTTRKRGPSNEKGEGDGRVD